MHAYYFIGEKFIHTFLYIITLHAQRTVQRRRGLESHEKRKSNFFQRIFSPFFSPPSTLSLSF